MPVTPVRWPIRTKRPKRAMPMRLPRTSTMRVSRRPRPRLTPRAPSTQLMGAMLAPHQIQNWPDTCGSGLPRGSAATFARPRQMLWDWSAEVICASIHGGVVPLRVILPPRTRDKIHFVSYIASSNGQNVMPMPLREVLKDPTVVAAEPLVLAGRTTAGPARHLGPHQRGARHRLAAARRRAAARGRGQPGDGVSPRNGCVHPELAERRVRGHRHRDGRAAARGPGGDGHRGRATATCP